MHSTMQQSLKRIIKSVLKEPLRRYFSLYVNGDLSSCSSNGWTKHLLPVRANRLAGFVDSSVLYGKDIATSFWISSRWGVTEEMKLSVEDDGMISHVSVGRQHLAILTANGNVYMSSIDHSRNPVISHNKLTSCERTIKQITCGLDHTLALTDGGQVFSCGWAADGQSGNGNEVTLTDFAPVVGEICHKNITEIGTCADSCFAIADDGVVFAWGNNEYHQLALDTSEIQVTIPQKCQLPTHNDRIIHIASGGAFTCFLTESGSIYGIGNILDNGGQLCLLYDGNSNTGPVTSVYAGLHYVVACCQEVLLVWGHYPSTSGKPQPLKLSAPSDSKIHSISPMLHELVLLMDV